jgi:HEAT repeat protein
MSRSDPTRRLAMVRASSSPSVIVEALSDSSPEVARAAISRLVELEGARAGGALRDRLLLVALPVVADVARALGSLGDTAAVDTAIGGLSDELYTHRLAAACALVALGDPRARGPLRAALSDPIAAVRAAAVAALARLGPEPGTATDCLRLFADPDAQVRIAAIDAVMRIAPGAADEVAALACDPELLVRREVAQHVSSLPSAAAPRLFTDVNAVVRQAAALAAGPQQTSLLALLVAEDPSSDVRRAAARALGKFDPDAVAGGLLVGIEDRDSLVRATAVQSLQRSLTHSGAVTRLSQELRSARPERRRWSLYALAHLHAELASSDVWRLADDPEPDVRLAVIFAAAVVLGDPEPLWLYMATDPDATVRAGAGTRVMRWRYATAAGVCEQPPAAPHRRQRG